MIRIHAAIAAMPLAAAALACGDYAHTNPYDPAVPVTIVISGPDTLFSYEQVAYYTAATMPAFADTALRWGSSDSTALLPESNGGFASLAPPLYPETRTANVIALIGQIDTITTKFIDREPLPDSAVAIPTFAWRHSGYTAVVLTQRVTTIQLRCPTVHACDTLSSGGTWSVWVDGFDALNHPIVALASATVNPLTGTAVATFAVRDTTIAGVVPVGIRVANVTALKTGATWVVATRGPLLDSLQLVVR
jgi:hypothetical protein